MSYKQFSQLSPRERYDYCQRLTAKCQATMQWVYFLQEEFCVPDSAPAIVPVDEDLPF